MNKSNSFFKSLLRNLGFVILALIIAYPHLVLARYTVPGADDFSCLNQVAEYKEDHNAVAAAVAYTADVYQTWQGTYTGGFIMGMEPEVRDSFTNLRLIMMSSVVLFAASIVFVMYTVCTLFFKLSSSQSWAVGLMAEFMAFNISLTGELFSWYTGAAVYTFPIVAMLFALGFSIRSFFDQKISYAILAGVFGMIGAGGSLEVVGFGCASYLVLLVVYVIGIKNIKANIKRLVFLGLPFVFTVAGALVNAAAPGNFTRHDVSAGGELEVVPSFTASFYNLMYHAGRAITDYLFPVVLAVIFIMCLVSASKIVITARQVTTGIAAVVFIAVVTIFPVILGYGSYNIDAYLTSTRITYTFDLVIILALMVLMCMISLFLRDVLKRNDVKVKEQAYKSLILLIALALLLSGEIIRNYQNGMSMRIMDDLKNNKIQTAAAEIAVLYDHIKEAQEGTDVVVYEPEPPVTVLYTPAYIEYPDYFANVEVAKYFNMNSLTRYWV